MTGYQSALLHLLSKALFGRNVTVQNQDWIGILEEAKNQAVVQLVYNALDMDLLSEDEAREWKRAASVDIANSIRIGHNHIQLDEWLGDIPYVTLKGASSALYYPVPTYRSMGDVDFLVKNEDLDRAGKVLEEHGLKPWKEKHISHIVYRGPRMHYEMHFNLAGTPNGSAGDLVREYTKDIFEETEKRTVGPSTAMLPSPFHHGLILLLHTCHHLTGEGVGLRHLCDWAVFENSFSEEEFRQLFENKLKKLGLWCFAQILTKTSIKYLGADERGWAEANKVLIDAVIEDIFASGNFGIKDAERSNQAYLISSRGKNGVGKTGSGKQLFISLNNVVYTRWLFVKKWKIILLIGWFYFGTKQVLRIARGERKKIHLKKMVEGAEERRELYAQMHFYEVES